MLSNLQLYSGDTFHFASQAIANKATKINEYLPTRAQVKQQTTTAVSYCKDQLVSLKEMFGERLQEAYFYFNSASTNQKAVMIATATITSLAFAYLTQTTTPLEPIHVNDTANDSENQLATLSNQSLLLAKFKTSAIMQLEEGPTCSNTSIQSSYLPPSQSLPIYVSPQTSKETPTSTAPITSASPSSIFSQLTQTTALPQPAPSSQTPSHPSNNSNDVAAYNPNAFCNNIPDTLKDKNGNEFPTLEENRPRIKLLCHNLTGLNGTTTLDPMTIPYEVAITIIHIFNSFDKNEACSKLKYILNSNFNLEGNIENIVNIFSRISSYYKFAKPVLDIKNNCPND